MTVAGVGPSRAGDEDGSPVSKLAGSIHLQEMAGQVARQTGGRLVSRMPRGCVRGRYARRCMQPDAVASSVLLTMSGELAALASLVSTE